jgi:hypothetical protein
MTKSQAASRLRVAVALLLGGLLSAACVNTEPTPAPGPIENGTIGGLTAAAHDETTQSPFDATLSPEGEEVYYIALGKDEDGEDTPGVFTVPAAGGAPTELALGDPLQGPAGVDITLDGATLLIADPAAEDEDADDPEQGALFAVPTAGGAPSVVTGTAGYAPTGVVVARTSGTEYAYFTGRDPVTQERGLFRVEPAGGAVESLAQGAPFSDPGGVAVNEEGVAFVVDGDPEDPEARVIKVERSTAIVIVEGIGVGYPAGIALSKDETVFLVSGIDPEAGHDTVYRVVVDSLEMTQISDPISSYAESAGLHRAHDAEVYAWADSEADGSGTVYVLTPPTSEQN